MLQAILLLVQSLNSVYLLMDIFIPLRPTPNKRTTKPAVDNTFGVAGFIQCWSSQVWLILYMQQSTC